MIEVILLTKLILLVVGVVSSVYGVSYVILGRFDIPFIPRKDSTMIGSMLIGIALALFIVSIFIP
ncbi:hypothetical protein L3N51_00503 [Metallosphaera sp. J1]|uniref:hypothetical protein n=1 Tax=Metallosphaera javensis (ex Hofmann et al. 2022) TaxID=99938 RepID=UPI001EDEDDEA|nr:hypothetical protein [Metallosphaera javensis (ex Hofmann et al. 2022)]MCG3108222.1 hypothetical protein [Metallosphaera javensis (ex Hofmann et al. 2022)]